MHQHTNTADQLTVSLAPQDRLGDVKVDAQRFASFDQRMTQSVDSLIQRWSHKAANADILGSTRTHRSSRP